MGQGGGGKRETQGRMEVACGLEGALSVAVVLPYSIPFPDLIPPSRVHSDLYQFELTCPGCQGIPPVKGTNISFPGGHIWDSRPPGCSMVAS